MPSLYAAVAVLALLLAVATTDARKPPLYYKGPALSTLVEWERWQDTPTLADHRRKPIMLVVMSSKGTDSAAFARQIHNSVEFHELSAKFVVSVVGDVKPRGGKAIPQPDGSYAPRVLFFTPDMHLLEVGNPKAKGDDPKYKYATSVQVVEAMKTALEQAKAARDDDGAKAKARRGDGRIADKGTPTKPERGEPPADAPEMDEQQVLQEHRRLEREKERRRAESRAKRAKHHKLSEEHAERVKQESESELKAQHRKHREQAAQEEAEGGGSTAKGKSLSGKVHEDVEEVSARHRKRRDDAHQRDDTPASRHATKENVRKNRNLNDDTRELKGEIDEVAQRMRDAERREAVELEKRERQEEEERYAAAEEKRARDEARRKEREDEERQEREEAEREATAAAEREAKRAAEAARRAEEARAEAAREAEEDRRRAEEQRSLALEQRLKEELALKNQQQAQQQEPEEPETVPAPAGDAAVAAQAAAAVAAAKAVEQQGKATLQQQQAQAAGAPSGIPPAPEWYHGPKVNPYIKWHKFQGAFSKAKQEQKPLMLVALGANCKHSANVAKFLYSSQEFLDLSAKFVMILTDHTSDKGDLSDRDKRLWFAPDGAYVPRILFITPSWKVMDIINKVNTPRAAHVDNQYFYYEGPPVIASMKRALKALGLRDFDPVKYPYKNYFPPGYDGPEINLRIGWKALPENPAALVATEQKPIMILYIQTKGCDACQKLALELATSEEIERLSKSFTMVLVSRNPPDVKPYGALIGPDGDQYVPRIVFANSKLQLLPVMNASPNPPDSSKYKYFFHDVDSVRKAMYRALAFVNVHAEHTMEREDL